MAIDTSVFMAPLDNSFVSVPSTGDTTGINYDALSTAIAPAPSVASTADSTGIDYNALSGAISPISTSGTSSGSAGDTSTSSDVFSGLSDIFGTIGTAVSQGLKSSQSSTSVIKPGQLVYNPSTGQYISTGVPVTTAGVVGGLNSNSLMLIIVAIIVYFAFFRRKSVA